MCSLKYMYVKKKKKKVFAYTYKIIFITAKLAVS